MPAELITVPTPSELKDLTYQLWSIKANRSAARTRRLLEKLYAEMPDLALPAEPTIRAWASRERWDERANAELVKGYPSEVRQFKASMWRLMQVSMERAFDVLSGAGPSLTKEEVVLMKLLWSAWGLGALGANQGGEISVPLEQTVEDLSDLTTDERLRRMRSLYVEANTGNA